MKTTSVHCKGVAAPAAAGHQIKSQGSTIKLGVDIHTRLYVVAAQHDHAALKPPRRCAPAEFLPWVESLVRAGHRVHVVYEACGFGFGLYRQLVAAGAHGYVIAPRKLDEERKGVKTDALDATTLCWRPPASPFGLPLAGYLAPLGARYLDGNTKEQAVIRVPSEEDGEEHIVVEFSRAVPSAHDLPHFAIRALPEGNRMRIQRPSDAHYAGIHALWWREVLAPEVENLPIIGQFQRRYSRAELVMKNGVVLDHEQACGVAPACRAQEESKRETVRALGQTLEAFAAAQRLGIDRAEPFRRHARVGHTCLEPATAIPPTW